MSGEWRRLHKEEHYDLYFSPNKIRSYEMSGTCSSLEDREGAYRGLVGT